MDYLTRISADHETINLCDHCVRHAVPPALQQVAQPENILGSSLERFASMVSREVLAGHQPLLRAPLASCEPKIQGIDDLMRTLLDAEDSRQSGLRLTAEDLSAAARFAEQRANLFPAGQELAVELSHYVSGNEPGKLLGLLKGCLGSGADLAHAAAAAALCSCDAAALARLQGLCNRAQLEPSKLTAFTADAGALLEELKLQARVRTGFTRGAPIHLGVARLRASRLALLLPARRLAARRAAAAAAADAADAAAADAAVALRR
jgi:hypothetical protein